MISTVREKTNVWIVDQCPLVGYFSLYGKKLDPEPGRCRRTDGKKWWCSKDAYPDSKYYERHMHHGRNRSRKPVETQQCPLLSQSQSSSSCSSSTVSVAPSTTGSFQRFPISSLAGGATGIRSDLSQLHLETDSYGVATRDFSSNVHCKKYHEKMELPMYYPHSFEIEPDINTV